MLKLETGEYVRTDEGLILKYDEEHDKIYIDNFINSEFLTIKNHSRNLIYILEVGDYINGYKVLRITGYYVLVESSKEYDLCFEEDEIKTILTKEQYEQNCFRVNDLKEKLADSISKDQMTAEEIFRKLEYKKVKEDKATIKYEKKCILYNSKITLFKNVERIEVNQEFLHFKEIEAMMRLIEEYRRGGTTNDNKTSI